MSMTLPSGGVWKYSYTDAAVNNRSFAQPPIVPMPPIVLLALGVGKTGGRRWERFTPGNGLRSAAGV
jgi:hypothetical protein